MVLVPQLNAKKIPLKWKHRQNAAYYVLEISSVRQFPQIAKKLLEPNENNYIKLPKKLFKNKSGVAIKAGKNYIKISLAIGVYYTRVAAVTTNGVKGYYSSVRILEVRPKKKTPPPKLTPLVEYEDEKVKVGIIADELGKKRLNPIDLLIAQAKKLGDGQKKYTAAISVLKKAKKHIDPQANSAQHKEIDYLIKKYTIPKKRPVVNEVEMLIDEAIILGDTERNFPAALEELYEARDRTEPGPTAGQKRRIEELIRKYTVKRKHYKSDFQRWDKKRKWFVPD